ncbi:MAG: phosphoribosylglycinamide formyltransferase [Planctomycetales bacterium]|nr:phosphoribosylglycinamide formyltransferase [Planctomycetales bacterium]
MSKPLPIAVLISGSGRSLRNLIERSEAGLLDIDIRLVIASKPSAGGLQFARDAEIPTAVVQRSKLGSDDAFGEAIFAQLRESGVEMVVLAGFMKFLPIPRDFENRVINIHPALIPAFCGRGYFGHHVHEAVLDYGAKVSGCTVHFVDNQYDHGPIILQRTVAVLDSDTPDALANRVFQAELDALPDALQAIAEGRVEADGRRIKVRD